MDYINISYKKVDSQGKSKVKYSVEDRELFAEETAIHYYNEAGYKGIWSENGYWWFLLGLLFWDVIFAKVNGAVIINADKFGERIYVGSPQYDEMFKIFIETNGMPADYFTPDFYRNREALINNRIKELKCSDIQKELEKSYKKNYGKYFRMIENWNKFSLNELKIVFNMLTTEKVLNILERIIKNITENRAGLPDLIVYNDKEFFLSEVKSEKDKLSEQQKEWISFLNSLDIKVQLCLINHTDKQIANMKKKENGNKKFITISFGNSTSKKRNDAIEFIQKQPTFSTKGDGKEQIYEAIFDVNDIENLYKMLDFTSGWKSQRIEIDGKVVKSTELRNALWCFREKNNINAPSDYCKMGLYDNEKNTYGCKNVTINTERWVEHGYISTDSGDWIFDKSDLNNIKTETIEKLSYCPLFDKTKLEKAFEKLPDIINPVKDKEWGYVSSDYNTWMYYDGEWIGSWGNTNFPGISSMIGIQKINKKELNEAIKYSKNTLQDNKISLEFKPTIQQNRKSGCFIATVVYKSYESPEVQLLRKYRDKELNRCFSGRIFISIYYKISPLIASILKKNNKLSNLAKYFLDIFVKRISDKYEN
ncbi:CFI-box-CTERM domain-containing protein [Clostridium sp. C2-6-12]|uniref:CFI-box-CTERM domain-containing protein n=1 Tax=Clostridium sp. C2-6-12 TaxID=2698832 RepID=UPI00136FA5C8|nr:CFI-box-CTERM domain-containing protein [Clostridium sp. C2-6-12]